MAREKARYSKPASQVDLEERQKNDNRSPRVLSTSDSYREAVDDGKAREFAVEDNNLDSYVGVDPVYQNYAVDTDEPLEAEDGPEAKLLEQHLAALDPQPTKQEEPQEEDEDDEEPDTGTTTTATITPAAPTSPDNSSNQNS